MRYNSPGWPLVRSLVIDMANQEILCVGEVVWDALPAALFLGGAPFNVACHLAAAGLPVSLVSRFYSGRLLPLDYCRILVGKPPISPWRALRCLPDHARPGW